ncbi:glycosyltransferase family 31 protein, partial [Teratosphaeria destructans]
STRRPPPPPNNHPRHLATSTTTTTTTSSTGPITPRPSPTTAHIIATHHHHRRPSPPRLHWVVAPQQEEGSEPAVRSHPGSIGHHATGGAMPVIVSGNSIRSRHFTRLLLGVGVIVLLVRLLAGKAFPQPSTFQQSISKLSGSAQFRSPTVAESHWHPRWGDDGTHLLPCAELPGANDTVVSMKTGATELEAKLPVHLHTTMRCFPNTLIYSDMDEDFQGRHMIDVLNHTRPDVRLSNPDFELWRRLNRLGRAGLKPGEVLGGNPSLAGGMVKATHPGFKLDKWKWLSMVNATYHEFPDKNWYIFMELDTFIIFPTLLTWLNTLSPQDPHYIGSQMQIKETVFGLGGAGFVMSRETMQRVAIQYHDEQKKWESEINQHWTGDAILGRVSTEMGCPLTWSWPVFQGLNPAGVDYAQEEYSKRLWCFPTVSYHRMTPEEIEDFWHFEMEWHEKHGPVIRHHQVYTHYVLPRIENLAAANPEATADWDNLSGNFLESPDADTIGQCRSKCEADEECVQYALSSTNKCAMSHNPKWGSSSRGTRSGWIMDRVRRWSERMESSHECQKEWFIKNPIFVKQALEESQRREEEEREREMEELAEWRREKEAKARLKEEARHKLEDRKKKEEESRKQEVRTEEKGGEGKVEKGGEEEVEQPQSKPGAPRRRQRRRKRARTKNRRGRRERRRGRRRRMSTRKPRRSREM